MTNAGGEPADATVPVGDAAAGTPEVGKKPRRLGVRSICAALCLILAALLLPLGVVGFWGQRTLTDTERFLDTVEPLIANEAFQQDLSQAVTNAIMKGLDTDKLAQEFLPPKAQALAGPIGGAIEQFVYQVTLKLVSSEQFQQLFHTVAGNLQQAVIKALSGDTSGAVKIEGDQIVLDLGDVIAAVQKKLGEHGLTAIADKPLPPAADRQIVLLNSQQLAQARFAYALSVPIARYLIVIVLLLFIAAIAISRKRWRMVGLVGGVGLFWAVILMIGLSIGQNVIGQSAAGSPFATSATVFYSTLLAYLSRAVTMLLILSIIIILVGWLFSNQRAAVKLRSATRDALSRSSDSATPEPPA